MRREAAGVFDFGWDRKKRILVLKVAFVGEFSAAVWRGLSRGASASGDRSGGAGLICDHWIFVSESGTEVGS
jgi:hypothetical protein